jgi:monovalent cation:H+ antiporter, CPA1 family
MELQIGQLEVLLLVAALVAILAARLRVPYVVGLVIAGIALSFFHLKPELDLTKELIFTALLPPLVFEAALYLRWQQLRRELPVVLLLATTGVAISALITALGMHYVVQWAWPSALIFGVLIAATDPVSVIATFKEQHVHGRLRLLVEAESLLNDGTAAVGFALALSFAQGMNVGGASIPIALLTISLGGIACGAAVAGLMLLIAGRTTNNLIELTLTTVVAYGSFLLADHFGLSGVLATVTAGLLVGNIGPLGSISAQGRASVQGFWEYAAFIANSIIFLLIGIHEAEQPFALILPAIAVAILFVLLGRALSVYPLCALFARSHLRVTMPHQHVLFWGGLRGALALALALGLPAGMPQANEIVRVTFAVVAFSVFVQGLTMGPLLRRLGEVPAH